MIHSRLSKAKRSIPILQQSSQNGIFSKAKDKIVYLVYLCHLQTGNHCKSVRQLKTCFQWSGSKEMLGRE